MTLNARTFHETSSIASTHYRHTIYRQHKPHIRKVYIFVKIKQNRCETKWNNMRAMLPMPCRLFCGFFKCSMTDLSHEFVRFFCVNKFFTTHTECMKPKKEGIGNDDSSVNENKNGGPAANRERGDISHQRQHMLRWATLWPVAVFYCEFKFYPFSIWFWMQIFMITSKTQFQLYFPFFH